MSFSAKLTIAILLSTSGLFGQAASAKPSPELTGIAHVAFRVANLDSSLKFYRALGFEVPFQLSKEGAVYEAFVKVNDRQFIELYPATAAESQIGFLHICFEGKDLVAVRSFYVEHGLQPSEIAKGGAGNLLFSMKGPATPMGPQNIEYTEYMPESMHSKDRGLHFGASRISLELLSVALPFDDPAAASTLYLDHAGFTKGAQGMLAIPGGNGQSVSLVSTKEQGYCGRITFAVDSLSAAKTELLKRKLHPISQAHALTLADPDGNVLLFSLRR